MDCGSRIIDQLRAIQKQVEQCIGETTNVCEHNLKLQTELTGLTESYQNLSKVSVIVATNNDNNKLRNENRLLSRRIEYLESELKKIKMKFKEEARSSTMLQRHTDDASAHNLERGGDDEPVTAPPIHESVSTESVSHESVSHESVSHESVSHESVSTESESHEAVSHEAVSHEAVSHEAVSHEAVSHEAVKVEEFEEEVEEKIEVEVALQEDVEEDVEEVIINGIVYFKLDDNKIYERVLLDEDTDEWTIGDDVGFFDTITNESKLYLENPKKTTSTS
jgi:hypothetical protein